MTKTKSSGGGAATAIGVNYQEYVTAWYEVHILAEHEATPPWDLPSDTIIEWLACETLNETDDLLIGLSGERHAFCQVKASASLSESPSSHLGKSFKQFIVQFTQGKQDTSSKYGFQKHFNSDEDFFVLITRSSSSKRISVNLVDLLRRIRSMPLKESLTNSVTNKSEKETLQKTIQLVNTIWNDVTGSQITDEELRKFLKQVYVQVLDVESGGKDAIGAENLLRSAVLSDTAQSHNAWNSLVTNAQILTAKKSSCEIIALQNRLVNESILLKGPRSYREDIARLIDHSIITASRLAHLSNIQVGGDKVKIDRKSTTELRKAIENTSILVTGEPGAGKSGVLYDLYGTLRTENRDVVFLAIDQFISRSDQSIENELVLSYELIKILDRWPGAEPGFILVDALDAARSNPVSKYINDLINAILQMKGRWRIVASIREYDLRYSPRLKDIFKGKAPTKFSDPNFSDQIHIQIPIFSQNEMSEVANQSSDLKKIIAGSNHDLQDLMKRPFNLRLVGELVGSGLSSDDLLDVHTSSSLLEKYWEHRVIGEDNNSGIREKLLRSICERMVSERIMRVQRSDTDDVSPQIALNTLLSNKVLMEWHPPKWNQPDKSNLVFSHHMLFDFAVFKLVLQGQIERVIEKLEEDPWLVVFYRPSLVYYFEFLWMIDESRESFWGAIMLTIQSQNIPEVGKLIGPAIAAELGENISEFQPLLDDLTSAKDVNPGRALKHLFGALLTWSRDEKSLVGSTAGPWCELVEKVSVDLTTDTAFTVRLLLFDLTKDPSLLTDPQRSDLGKVARRLLKFSLEMDTRNSWLVTHAIEAVCLTYESNVENSRTLLQQLLGKEHLSQFGYEELPRYADSVKRLCDFDPEIVENIYTIAFNNPEPSEETTVMNDSKIMRMTSTKRQDYGGGLYLLGEAFPAILKKAPILATRVIISVIKSYVELEHATVSGEIIEESFPYNDDIVTLRQDYSCIWDQGTVHQHDPPIKMLNAFQDFISELVTSPEGIQEFKAILDVLVNNNQQAILWRRLVMLGTLYPEEIGITIAPLAYSHPILIFMDTSSQAGELLKKIFPRLNAPEKQKIENAILSIPDKFPEKPELAEQQRNRLLGCLDIKHLVLEKSKDILSGLLEKKSVPLNEPPVQIGRAKWGGEYGEEEFLADEGVAIDDPPNKSVRVLEEPVKQFNKDFTNSNIETQDALDIYPALQNLHSVISTADNDGVDPKQKNHAMGELAAACASIAELDNLGKHIEIGEFVKAVLVEASNNPAPEPNPVYDAQFEGHPSWGGNQPRIEAAKGLIVLTRVPVFLDSELLDVVEKLSEDDVPAVRFQIAIRLNAMYKTRPDVMWKMLANRVRAESSNTILQWLIEHPIRRLERAELPKLYPIVEQLFKRINASEENEIQDACMGFFLSQFIWNNHAQSEKIIFTSLESPETSISVFNRVLHQFRELLQYGQFNGQKTEDDCIRDRTIKVFAAITRHCKYKIIDMQADAQKGTDEWWTDDKVADFRELHKLLDKVGSEIYFASGAFKAKKTVLSEKGGLSEEEKRFYYEMHDIIRELSSIGLPSLIHHLVETIEFFIPIEPEEVFITLTQLVKSGREWDYQFESLAIGIVVRIVERYFAEYREILQASDDCQRGLIEILDTFVSVGWPEARRLTFRMEEIYR